MVLVVKEKPYSARDKLFRYGDGPNQPSCKRNRNIFNACLHVNATTWFVVKCRARTAALAASQ